MKKISIKLILLIVFTITLITFDNNDVFTLDADISVTPTGSSGTNSCSYAGNCYSLGTGGVRITLLDGNANKVKNTIDLWYYGNSLSFYDNNSAALVYYKNKYLRQDLSKMNHKDVHDAIKLNSSSKYTFTSIEKVLPKILGKGNDLKKNNNKFSSGYGNSNASENGKATNEYDWAYAKQNNRVPNMTAKIMDRIYTNIKKETTYGGSNQSKQLYLKNILSAMGTSIDKIDDSYTLQFEPLVNWENGRLDNGINAAKFTSFNFLGTISELYVLYYNYNKKYNNPENNRISNIFCKKGNTTNYCYSGAFAPFNNINIPEFKRIVDGSGIYVDNSGTNGNVIPTNSKNKAIFKTTTNGNPGVNDLGSKLDVAYGVGFISLSKLIDSFGCVKVVDSDGGKKDSSGNTIGVKASNYKKVNEYGVAVNKYLKSKKVATYSWLNEASKYGFSSASQLKKYITNNASCDEPSCGSTYTIYSDSKYSKSQFINSVLDPTDSSKRLYGDTYIKNNKEEWNLLIKQSIDKHVSNNYIKYKTGNNDVCKASTCQNTLDYIRSYQKNNYLLTKKYSKLSDTEKKLVEALHVAFPKEDYLNPNIIGADALDEIPQCGKTAPKCDVNKVSECKAPYYIKVGLDATSSSEYKSKCILSDYLFTNYKGSVKKKNSKRAEYNGVLNDSSSNSIYCSEYVEIHMPKEGSEITKAGRVFQWGTNITKSSNKGLDSDGKTYAKMIVKQQCFKGPKKANGTSTDFYPNELNRFKNINLDRYNTIIKLSYTDPTKTFSYNDLKLNTIFLESSSKGMSIYNKNMVTLYSIYNIDYGKSLTWYSHKGNSEEDMIDKNDYNNLSNIQKNEYLFIGYGAPTSFNTADGTYKESISAKITKIGYKGQYDSLFSNSIAEYKCDFKIHNEIIGNECCDTTTGKPFPGAPAYCTCDGGDGPKGLDVAFRTIQLVNKNASSSSINSEINKAFPGRTGAGRNLTGNIGKNWKTLIDSDTKTVLNILRDDIYSGAPQYTISLDVGKISAIRESNKALRDKSIDPYTYRGKVKNGTGYTCHEYGKYGYCRSEFVKEYLEGKCATRSGTLETKPCE